LFGVNAGIEVRSTAPLRGDRLDRMARSNEPIAVPQMTAAEFAAALRHHSFRVARAKIEDATGRCPGIRWPAILRGRSVDHNRTLAKVIRERDAEIARRALRETDPK
jgi:hypothetical protein